LLTPKSIILKKSSENQRPIQQPKSSTRKFSTLVPQEVNHD